MFHGIPPPGSEQEFHNRALQTLPSLKHTKPVPAKHWNRLAGGQALSHWKNLLTPPYCPDEMHFLFLELFIPQMGLNNLSSVLQAISSPRGPTSYVNLLRKALTAGLPGPVLLELNPTVTENKGISEKAGKPAIHCLTG